MKIPPSPRTRVVCSVLFIVLLTGIAYSGSLTNDFVDWDDQEYVVNNPNIKNFSWHTIEAMFSSIYQATYDPLVFLSFSAEYALFKLNPFYYHLDNTILHCINSVLVFCLLFLVSNSLVISGLSAALFGVHPLHVESVAWITERKDVLSTLFFLLAFFTYMMYRQRSSWKLYALTVLLFLLSLLSKPTGITLPVMLFIYDTVITKKRAADCIVDKVPLLVLSVICGAVTLYAQKTGGGVDIEVSYSFVEKLYIIYYSYFFYIVKTLLPFNLSALYPYPKSIAFFTPLSGAAALTVVLFAAGICYLRRSREVVFYALFFCITLMPGLKVIPFGNTLVADRFAYIPSIGLLALLATGMVTLCNLGGRWKVQAGIWCSIIIAGFFSLLTYERCSVWKDSMTLWTDTVNKSPESELARYGLATAQWRAGNLNRAIAEFRTALMLAPTYVDAYVSLGNALRLTGKRAEAKEMLTRALAFNVKKTRAYLGLADLCREEGLLDDALAYYQKSAQEDPLLPEAYVGMGHVYRRKGMSDKAQEAYAQALSLNPDLSSLHTELGLFYRDQGEREEAIKQYQMALALDPHNAEAYNNLGWIYQQQGALDQALKNYESALASNPSLLTAYDNMVQAYLKQNNTQQAVATYKHCLAANETAEAFQRLISLYFKLNMKDAIIAQCALIKPESPLYADSLLCLGDLYRKEGNTDKAIALYEQARAALHADPRILFSLGMAFVQQGKTAAAKEQLEQARALGFKNPALSMRLGIIYLSEAAMDKAVTAFTEVLEMDARAVLPHVYLAQIYAERLQDKKKALYHLRTVIEIDPHNSRAEKIQEDIRRLEQEIEQEDGYQKTENR